MKRLYPLLFISVLIYWSCEDEQPEDVDTTPPTVTITSPQDGSTVSVSITITCISSDNEGVDKVELWVNGVTTGVTDDTEPYSFEWNTMTLEDGNYTIIVRSYDLSGNTTDSEPIILTVHNTPTEVTLWGVIYSIENTTELNLWDNEFTGEIPSEIGYLTNLTYLDLSYNQLTGSIPSEIGNLTNLDFLNLGSNNLTGSIPPEIGNLTNLTDLYLDGNQLTGVIPESICDLNIEFSNSDYFNISNNQLCPPYPSCIEDYVGEQDTSGCP